MSTTLTIPDLDEAVEQKLRIRAASHGRSLEAEAREILSREVQSGIATETIPVIPNAKGKFDHLIGIWAGRMTTDEIMELTRGDDIDDAYSRR